MAEDMVRLECKITGWFNILIDQDVYEAWKDGDAVAGVTVANYLFEARREAARDAEDELIRAVLEDEEGNDVVVLKVF